MQSASSCLLSAVLAALTLTACGKRELDHRLRAGLCTDPAACAANAPDGSGGDAQSGDAAPAAGETTAAAADRALLLFPDSDPVTAPARLWRLTVKQFGNTVRSILGSSAVPEAAFDHETHPEEGFGTEAESLGIDLNYASNLESALSGLLRQAGPDLARLLPCKMDEVLPPACLQGFINAVGSRAFRRPLTGDEVARYTLLFNAVKAKATNADALAAVTEGLLRSPFTQFRMELAASQTEGAGSAPLSPDELATALAFAATNAPPDEALRTAAASGELGKAEVFEAQARRLLASEAFLEALTEFFFRFTGVTWLDAAEKNADSFPDYTPAVKQAMVEEARAFLKNVLTNQNGSFRSLMRSSATTITPALAGIYNLPPFAGTTAYTPPAGERSGYFTLPAVIAANTLANATSPVKRGIFLLKKLMCLTLPAPPPDAGNVLPVVDQTLTLRERFAAHRSNPSCAGCHVKIDPFGFSLENFDPIGRFRTTDNGKPVDATGTVTGTKFSNTTFNSGVELLAFLADSPDVQACFVKNAFRYTFGRAETDGDNLVLRAAYERFVGADLDIRELFYALYTSNAFQLRQVN